MKKEFYEIHQRMRCDSDELAACAVNEVINSCKNNIVQNDDELPDNNSSVHDNIEPEVTLPQNAELKGESEKTEPKFGEDKNS